MSRENTSRRIQIEKILEDSNREAQVGKQQFRTYKSEHINRENTNWEILIEKNTN